MHRVFVGTNNIVKMFVFDPLLIISKSRYMSPFRGWSSSSCLRRHRVGGKANVYVCQQGVGGWSKKDKILST